jgi:hypothetical protein
MEKNIYNGLSERHVAQIIRRKMIQKVKPSGKAYKREKFRFTSE